MFTKIIVFILGLVAASLPVTGFLVWEEEENKENTRSAKPGSPACKHLSVMTIP